MRRNPSGSHCVQNTPDDRYRPSSATFFSGAMRERTTIVPLSGASASVSAVGETTASPLPSGRPSSSTRTFSCCSPSSTSGVKRSSPTAAGLRRYASVVRTSVASGSRSISSVTLSTRNAGGR
jgi:hypothetical protein